MENLKEQIEIFYVKEGQTTKYISEVLNLPRKKVQYWISKWKFTQKNRLSIIPEKISLDNLPFCYFLGLWIADGWINKKQNVIALSLKEDKDILEAILKHLTGRSEVNTYRKSDIGKAIYNINFGKDENLLKFLHLHGLDTENKTFEARLPEINNKESAKMLLRGLIDGDGNIKYGFRLFTASEALKNGVVKYLKVYFNYTPTVSKTKTRHTNGYTISTKVDFLPILIDIYQGYDDLRIKRKKNALNKKVHEIVHSHKMINYGSWDLIP